MRLWTPFTSLDSLKGKEDRVFVRFNWNTKEKLKLVSAGNHEALFQLLHNGEYKWVLNLNPWDIESSALYKLSNSVKYGDLRNLKRDGELEILFDTYIKHIYDTFEKWQAEDFLNNNEWFRIALKNIRKWPLFFPQAKDFLENLPASTQE